MIIYDEKMKNDFSDWHGYNECMRDYNQTGGITKGDLAFVSMLVRGIAEERYLGGSVHTFEEIEMESLIRSVYEHGYRVAVKAMQEKLDSIYYNNHK